MNHLCMFGATFKVEKDINYDNLYSIVRRGVCIKSQNLQRLLIALTKACIKTNNEDFESVHLLIKQHIQI